MTAFKIGSIYRDGHGRLYRLWAPTAKQQAEDAKEFPGAPTAVAFQVFRETGLQDINDSGRHFLADGRFWFLTAYENCGWHLIPGECDEHGNPLEDKKEPEGVIYLTPEKAAARSPLDTCGAVSAGGWFPYTESSLDCGQGMELFADRHGKLFCRSAVTKTPTLDKLENEREPQRAPLPGYGQSTPFDNFKGYAVKSNTSEHHSAPFLCASPDLQDESAARHLLVTVKA